MLLIANFATYRTFTTLTYILMFDAFLAFNMYGSILYFMHPLWPLHYYALVKSTLWQFFWLAAEILHFPASLLVWRV